MYIWMDGRAVGRASCCVVEFVSWSIGTGNKDVEIERQVGGWAVWSVKSIT